jgi:hypothetical protein
MIKYICNYCENQFNTEEEYEKHFFSCTKNPFLEVNKISLYSIVVHYNFEKNVYSITKHKEHVYEYENKYVQLCSILDEVDFTEICKKEEIDCVQFFDHTESCVGGGYNQTFDVLYYSLMPIEFAEINKKIEDKIKEELLKKVNKLNNFIENLNIKC